MFGSNNGDATRVKYTEKSLKTTLGFLFHVSSIHAFRILANFSPLRVRFLLAHLNNRETWLNSHDSRVSKTNHFVKWRRNGIRTILFLFLPSFRAYRARTELITWKRARRSFAANGSVCCSCSGGSSFSLLKPPKYLMMVHRTKNATTTYYSPFPSLPNIPEISFRPAALTPWKDTKWRLS